MAAAATAGLASAVAQSSNDNERHKQAQTLTSKLQDQALYEGKHHHVQAILADLREHDKEADRDLWEQRSERFQTLMTISGLLFAGAFALAVEGQLPGEPGVIDIPGDEQPWLSLGSLAAQATFLPTVTHQRCR